MVTNDLARLTDGDLILHVRRLSADERGAMTRLITALAELDARRLYLEEGCSSMYTYCTEVLHLSEHAAYHRIEAARAARRFPIILERLAAGELTLTTVTLLAPHLTLANHLDLLDAARHKGKRDVERQIAVLRQPQALAASAQPLRTGAAELAPTDSLFGVPVQVPVPTSLIAPPAFASAALSSSDPGASKTAVFRASASGSFYPRIAAVGPDQYRLQFTITAATHDKLRRAQDLLRHALPGGDPADIFDRALTLLVEQLERRRTGRTGRQASEPTKRPAAAAKKRQSARHNRPKPTSSPNVARSSADADTTAGSASGVDSSALPTAPEPTTAAESRGVIAIEAQRSLAAARRRARYVPAAMRRAVWTRDEGRCAFIGTQGRCSERGMLELHHVIPFAEGGATTIDNLELRCRAHNRHEARVWAGNLWQSTIDSVRTELTSP